MLTKIPVPGVAWLVGQYARGFEQLGPAWFRDRASEIRAAYALLADDHSCEVFTQVLHTHVARMPVPIRYDCR